MSATSTATIPNQIGGNLASQYSGESVSTRTIDEAQYHTAPTQLFPNTVQEEINSIQPQDFMETTHGELICLGNTAKAFAIPGYGERFQNSMQDSIRRMIGFAQANNQFKPVISLQNVDYADFGLHSTKEYFQVDSDTLQNIKSDPRLKALGYTAFAKPTGNKNNPFELTVYAPNGEAITGSKWNDFFDFYHNLPPQETPIAS